MKLSDQEKKVYDFIKANPGCTTHDITVSTFVQKPCARIVGLENKGVKIERKGSVKYGNSRPFKRLYLEETVYKYEFDPSRQCMVEVLVK